MLLTKTYQEKELADLKEKIEFYESILNKLPAIVYINEIERGGDISTLKCIWSNKWALDFIGYPQETITKMGYDFVKKVIHPDDIQLAPQSLEIEQAKEEEVFFALSRQKPKNKDDYQWIYSRTLFSSKYPDGSPKQSLNVGFELHNELHSPNQLVNLLQEINCLKHALKLKSLTRRENEIIKLIAKGLTDKVIATALRISVATAKTHRNKIIKKLKLKNSAALAAFAAECGL